MTARSLLTVSLVAVALVCVGLVALTVVARVTRLRRARRLERLAAPHRRLLLEVAAGEDDDGSAAAALAALPPAAWRSLRPVAVAMLGKVRGAPATAIVATLDAHGEIDRARAALGSRSALRRANAAHLLGIVRDEASGPRLVALLDDRDEDVRVVCARALGRIGEASAADALLRAAGPRAGRKRRRSAAVGDAVDHGVGPAGRPAGIPAWIAAEALLALREDAADTVARGVGAPDPGVRAVAVTVTTHAGHSEAVELVRDHLPTERDPDVLEAMVECLGRVGVEADAPLLVGLTRAGSAPGLRRHTVRALGRLGGPTALERLRELLSDPDRATAAVAAEALLDSGHAGVAVLQAERLAHPATARAVSAALHLAGLRGVAAVTRS
ncbi:HEAT repeat domain-containing protein [Agilicoccus flavus]|uniref:HEAT repeat domain-containing protein n=1 Tax=Agilicoccus flavus TaxID=2775968 RepID=UPI001CF6087A|nr:HEAT repeat domain-containing protein [Agilicoccus flavus]